MADGPKESEGVELDLTPMIDCVFLLLIFFMVTTVFTTSAGLKIVLPEAKTWQPVRDVKLTLSIGAAGGMELNGKVVSKASLAGLLMAEKERTKSITLIVKADEESLHEYTLDAMEVAKEVGVETISLAVDKPEDGSDGDR